MRHSLDEGGALHRARARRTVNFGNFRQPLVKQLNAFPLIVLLIVVLGMIYWFSGLRG